MITAREETDRALEYIAAASLLIRGYETGVAVRRHILPPTLFPPPQGFKFFCSHARRARNSFEAASSAIETVCARSAVSIVNSN